MYAWHLRARIRTLRHDPSEVTHALSVLVFADIPACTLPCERREQAWVLSRRPIALSARVMRELSYAKAEASRKHRLALELASDPYRSSSSTLRPVVSTATAARYDLFLSLDSAAPLDGAPLPAPRAHRPRYVSVNLPPILDLANMEDELPRRPASADSPSKHSTAPASAPRGAMSEGTDAQLV